MICAEGPLWQSQRRFVSSAMREGGMTNVGDGKARENMEYKIMGHVKDFLSGI